MTAQTSRHNLAFRLPDMLSYHSTWDDADYAPQVPPRRPGLIARTFAGLRARFQAHRERQAAVAELSAMSDRELADIGINRYDVNRLFDPAFVREYANRGM
ncbi:MAG TPA: DUF1127 domain-containing protein [Acetobacteraceae bacterium]|nr:DUF1127 domain-containing protein [Acetobacteraceae bacterium]